MTQFVVHCWYLPSNSMMMMIPLLSVAKRELVNFTPLGHVFHDSCPSRHYRRVTITRQGPKPSVYTTIVLHYRSIAFYSWEQDQVKRYPSSLIGYSLEKIYRKCMHACMHACMDDSSPGRFERQARTRVEPSHHHLASSATYYFLFLFPPFAGRTLLVLHKFAARSLRDCQE